jgi:hypothetical protein
MQKCMVNVRSLVIELKCSIHIRQPKAMFAGLVYIPVLEGKYWGKDQLWF